MGTNRDAMVPARWAPGSPPSMMDKPGQHPQRYGNVKTIIPTRARTFGNPGYEEPNPEQCVEARDPGRGYVRGWAPEAYLGDANPDPTKDQCDKGRLIAGYETDSSPDKVQLLYTDYTTVGPVGQARAVFHSLYALGIQNVSRYVLVVAGTSATYTFTAAVDGTGFIAPAAGIRLDWGVQLLNFAPFDLQISTTGFVNVFTALANAGTAAGFTQSVDRNITLRVNGVNGGAIYLPFALRITPSMNMAMMQLGTAHIIAAPPPSPSIQVTGMPATIAAAFSATAQFLSAFSPITAAYGGWAGVMSDG